MDQITSLVSIFSFGQQLFSGSSDQVVQESAQGMPKRKTPKEKDNNEDDSDSDSDTSSDSGHSSDDHENNTDDKGDESELTDLSSRTGSEIPETRCASEVKEKDLEISALSPSVAAAV